MKKPDFSSFNPGKRASLGKLLGLSAACLSMPFPAFAQAGKHRDEVARLAAKSTGLDLPIMQRAFARAPFSHSGFTEEVLDEQQQTADVFFTQKLIPKRIDIRDIVWRG
ncbi:MAG: hypothetical protein LBL48_10250 [Azoarcus sp.]|jgi:ABC-type nitrate/sulfonate/bicarbonate transport system substrate-binding protein|nr:hypothetical protein [Azoarcus sp.]